MQNTLPVAKPIAITQFYRCIKWASMQN